MHKTSLNTVNNCTFYQTLKKCFPYAKSNRNANSNRKAVVRTSAMLLALSMYFAFYQNHSTKFSQSELFY